MIRLVHDLPAKKSRRNGLLRELESLRSDYQNMGKNGVPAPIAAAVAAAVAAPTTVPAEKDPRDAFSRRGKPFVPAVATPRLPPPPTTP